MKRQLDKNEKKKFSLEEKKCILKQENEDSEQLSLNLRNIVTDSEDDLSEEINTTNDKKEMKNLKSLHESLPNVTLTLDNTDNKLSSGFNITGSDFSVNGKEKRRLSVRKDYENIIKLIANLQNIAESISTKYDKTDKEISKSSKHLNFRSHDDIINSKKELLPTDFVILEKGNNVVCKPEMSSGIRKKHRLEPSPDRDSPQFFLESEKLLDCKPNESLNIKWSDANSVTSPCSTIPESPFESSKRYRSQNVVFPRRSVLKNGECNVLKKSSTSKRRIRYLQDIFTTLVDIKWRWTLVVFALSFIMSWLFYAGLYWLIAFSHGDFEHLDDENWTPCVENLMNFASCFLFSVETQHTIGYGGRATTEECPEAIFVMCIQSITGVMISAFMAGIFFAKMARPKQRRQTLLFSRKAVVCQRDAQMCLMFRVGDMRKSQIIGTNIRAHIFRTRTTREGEELPQYQCELQVSADGCESNLFFIWPLTVVHVIDKNSPLYTMSAQELLHENFEVVAILEGTVESTGQTTQARTSYLPSEIKWGHRFESILSYNSERQCYEIDYKKFNNTIKVSTPLCSAKDLNELFMVQSEMCEYNIMTSDPETENP